MSTRPRAHITMVVANNPYPQDLRVRNEAEALVRLGHEVTVVAQHAQGQLCRETVSGVEVRRFRPPPEGRSALGYVVEFAGVTLSVMFALLRLRAGRRVDVVHLHNPPDTLVVAALPLKLFGAKLVFDQHDLSPELYDAKFDIPSRSVKRGLVALESASYRFTDMVIATNESYKKLGVERHGVPASKVHVVRNGPRLSRLDVAVEPAESLANRAQLVVGYLGHIAKQDGVDHLLLALAALENELGFSDWFAVIVGPAEDPTQLEALAQELGIGHKVWFTGYKPDPEWRSLIAATDVCVVPDPPNALNERSTMVKLLEYMALGKPVVAYDLTENRVSAGPAALYAEPGRPPALAAALLRLAREDGLAKRVGDAGRERIKQSLAWEYSEAALASAYETLLSPKHLDNVQMEA